MIRTIRHALENDRRITSINDLSTEFYPETNELLIKVSVNIGSVSEPQEFDLILKKTR